MVPRHPIPNMVVKRCCGENTSGAVLWENSTTPKLLFIIKQIIFFFLNSSAVERSAVNR